ncbi:hypothetical protein GGF31_006755 [Allomyces arbusculus]|nr:hypothetical protein GGF31_006755 [Allomyces arbusculus]
MPGVIAVMLDWPFVAAVRWIGFTAMGILKGSFAAWMMRVLGGALTPKGGLVALLQAIGATGRALFAAFFGV